VALKYRDYEDFDLFPDIVPIPIDINERKLFRIDVYKPLWTQSKGVKGNAFRFFDSGKLKVQYRMIVKYNLLFTSCKANVIFESGAVKMRRSLEAGLTKANLL
jgi:hypothetical protein